jgi:hypothetical protein
VSLDRVALASLSAAMDGGFTAMADISRALTSVGAAENYRLIGGVSVLLHVQRLGVAVPLRATGDADFGTPPYVLRRPELLEGIEARGYEKVRGNRWQRHIDERRVATVDLLIPSYTTRIRDTVRVGGVVTTEVPGLAEALRRPGVTVEADLLLTDGTVLDATVVLPDPIGALALKAGARTVRDEERDASDLWRCLEIAAADGVVPSALDADDAVSWLRGALWRELGPDGRSLPALANGLQPDAAARARTRVRALLAEVIGPEG